MCVPTSVFMVRRQIRFYHLQISAQNQTNSTYNRLLQTKKTGGQTHGEQHIHDHGGQNRPVHTVPQIRGKRGQHDRQIRPGHRCTSGVSGRCARDQGGRGGVEGEPGCDARRGEHQLDARGGQRPVRVLRAGHHGEAAQDPNVVPARRAGADERGVRAAAVGGGGGGGRAAVPHDTVQVSAGHHPRRVLRVGHCAV